MRGSWLSVAAIATRVVKNVVVLDAGGREHEERN